MGLLLLFETQKLSELDTSQSSLDETFSIWKMIGQNTHIHTLENMCSI